MQLSARLGQHSGAGQKQRYAQDQGTFQARTSCFLSKTWKELTTIMSTRIGKNRQGSGRNVTKLCISRSKLPNDGKGSETPSPSAPRLASAMIKTGTEIQNCASSVPRKLGSRCNHMSLKPEKPAARAVQTNSDCINAFVPAQITREDAAHPSSPRRRKVTAADACGETFKGKAARTVISRKSQGTERTRSARNMQTLSVHPPKQPAIPPSNAARKVVNSAASGARVRATRMP